MDFTFGSLFSGIGGMDLGLERAGMQCQWQVEIDPYARRVLAKHWPGVQRHGDIRTFPPDDGADWKVDLIAGGFPCQDISFAGKGAGLSGKRSGLWYEFARVLRVLRPEFVLVENVAALLKRGLRDVLGTLASLGYDAEWSSVSACEMGAPHMRQRVFIVCHASFFKHRGFREKLGEAKEKGWMSQPLSGPGWDAEPEICRVANGVPSGVDRLRTLGNAVVPQVAEWIGRRILEARYGDSIECVGGPNSPSGIIIEDGSVLADRQPGEPIMAVPRYGASALAMLDDDGLAPEGQ